MSLRPSMNQRPSNRNRVLTIVTYSIIGGTIIAALMVIFYYGQRSERKNRLVDIDQFEWAKKVTIDQSLVSRSVNLENFPLFMHFDSPELIHKSDGGLISNESGFDILFVDQTENVLDHDLVEYDPKTGELKVWVKVPLLSGESDTEITFLYGNEEVKEDLSNSFTWEDNYAGVWHLDSSESDNGLNSLSTRNINAQLSEGFAGNAYRFQGEKNNKGAIIHVEDHPKLDLEEEGTIEAWIKVNTFQDWAGVIYKGDKKDYSDDAYFLQFLGGTEKKRLSFGITDHQGLYNYERSYIDLEEDTWYHVAFSWDQQKLQLYVNGYDYGTKTNTVSARNTTGGLNIGSQLLDESKSNPFDGIIDEVRISNVARSEDWIRASYKNQIEPKRFVRLGGQLERNQDI